MRSTSIPLLLTLCAASLPAQSVLPADLVGAAAVFGVASVDVVSSPGPGFTDAFRITTHRPGRTLSLASLRWTNSTAIKAADRLTLTFWVRKVAPDDIYNLRGTVSLESDDADPLLDTVFPCSLSTWTKYSFPVTAARDYDPGQLRLVFRHGLGPQTYELGGIQFTNRGAPPPPPAPLGFLIPADSTHTYAAFFDNTAGGGSAKVVPATGPGFTQAIQIQVNGTSPFIYNAQLGWVTTASVAKNDAVLLSFYARALENGPIQGQIVFERNGTPFDKSLTFTFPVAAGEWQLLQAPFLANDNYKPAEAHLQVQFAAGPQRFEIAALQLQNYGPLKDLTALPSQTATIVDATQEQLLTEARQRITAIRQVPLSVLVTDADGHPLPGIEVRVQQLRHAFRFGSAVVSAGLKQAGQDNDIYRSRIASHFTTSVLENDLKWPTWECTTCRPSFDQAQTRDGIQWLLDHGIPLRGHNLIWPSFRNMPSDVQRLTGDNLRTRITRHFENVLNDSGVYGKLYQWDVVNEPFDNYDVQGRVGGVAGIPQSDGLLGNSELLAWYRQARALAPNAQLILNDYNNIETATPGQHEDYTIRFLEWMQENSAPLDGIGLQAHFGGARTLARMQQVIDRFGRFRLPLAITEFDVNTSDEQAQATFTRDFMTLIFSRPEFSDFLMWGFWSGRHWLPQAAMYAADWTSKANALVYNRLLFQDWWSNSLGVTDAAGQFPARVFKGDYQITVITHTGFITQTVTVTDPKTVSVALPRSP